MGSRNDDFLDDEPADAALRRLLARSGQPAPAPSPPDLVTRTMRLLPAHPPAIAARNARRRAAARLALRLALAVALALVALAGIWSVVGGGPSLGLLLGDGTSGISRALLTIELLAKPLLRTVGAGGALWLLAGLLALAGAGWLWWRLLRRTPVYYTERAT
jgi:hypothetical protein